nr:MAG TPA: hypothetical protein [Caudoviricetes sp.]
MYRMRFMCKRLSCRCSCSSGGLDRVYSVLCQGEAIGIAYPKFCFKYV